MLILNDRQIRQKIKRLALEIVEKNYTYSTIIIVGINNKGYAFAELLSKEVGMVHEGKVQLRRLKINPASPVEHPIYIENFDENDFNDAAIILTDDVANTGRTLFYAFKPLLEKMLSSLQVAVLVDRKHKTATTFDENIQVKFDNTQELSVFLN
mgnify:CR=1 FL=1